MVGMVAKAELVQLGRLQEVRDVIGDVCDLFSVHETEIHCQKLKRSQQEVMEMLSFWRTRQAEKHTQNLELQQQVAVAERKLVSAKMDSSSKEGLQILKEQLAQAQSREKQMQEDCKDLEECIEAIEAQMSSIRLQKETLDKPDAEEAFLKNELSLFLNVSSILPDLGDPKFSGTFVDKQKGVKSFKFSAEEMSSFETCRAAWDMMS